MSQELAGLMQSVGWTGLAAGLCVCVCVWVSFIC